TGAEHPLIAAHAAHAAADLVGERLKSQPAGAGSERARDRAAGPSARLGIQEAPDCLLKMPRQHVRVAVRWNVAAGRDFGQCGQMVALDGGEKGERANPLVEVAAAAPQALQGLALGQQAGGGSAPAQALERPVSNGRIRGNNGADQLAHWPGPASASSRRIKASRICESTSVLSRPVIASNNCAMNGPYGAPRSTRRSVVRMARYLSRCTSSASAADSERRSAGRWWSWCSAKGIWPCGRRTAGSRSEERRVGKEC